MTIRIYCTLIFILYIWFNLIFYPLIHGDRHQIILIPYVVAEIFTKTIFSVMAALLCLEHKIFV